MADTQTESDGQPDPLTEREQEILDCLVEGLSNKEIAERLHLADITVRWYNSHIYSKLGVSNRQEAAEWAERKGISGASSTVSSVSGKQNLPYQSRPFVGRQRELTKIAHLLANPNLRLLTILAPSGMGKTRLALEAANTQIGQYKDGVFFIPLAPLTDANDIITTIAENIGFSFHGEDHPAQQLIDFLSNRSLLLVLDNFEHLLAGVPFVADLVRTAPRVRILTTSRERLNLRSETIYALRGLNFPMQAKIEDVLEYDAVRLFMQSAHRVRPDFELQTSDLGHLSQICHLTAGMPLAIELAAGWIDVLSLEHIASEIQQGFDILEMDLYDVPERHRSVRSAFEHTWKHLTETERQIFMRLSVFSGGFSAEAASVVADTDLRSLRQLVNKALVQISPEGRHGIHELLRQFGAEKLSKTREQEVLQARHAAFFADFMSERGQEIRTDKQLEALQQIDPEFENVRLVWIHAVNHQVWDQIPKFLYSLRFYLVLRTRAQEGIDLMSDAVHALRSEPPSATTDLALGRVLARLAWFYYDIGLAEKSETVCDEAIRILRQHDSREDLVAALYVRQAVALAWNHLEIASDSLQEGLRLARSIGDRSWEGHLLLWLAISHNLQNDFASGLPFVENAYSIFEALGDRWGFMRVYELLGVVTEDQTNYTQARQWFQKALTLAETFGQHFDIAQLTANMARIPLLERDYVTARLYLKESLRTYWDAGYKWAVPYPLAYMAQLFAEQGEVENAVEILATIHKHLTTYKRTSSIAQAVRAQLETSLEPERFTAAWAMGEQRDLDTLVNEVLSDIKLN